MNTNQEIIDWLKANSSGVSKDAAERLEACLFVIRELVSELPTNRDWWNPDLEDAAREIISWDNIPAELPPPKTPQSSTAASGG